MSIKLLAQHQIDAKNLDLGSLDPSYRRATLNMTAASLACEKVLAQIQDVPRDQISVLMATHFGEVESSLDFLTTYHKTKIPRPILFQNSLHNSTLGFTAIQFGLQGPAFTVSTDELTTRATADLAETLFRLTPYVLVCFVDVIPDHLAGYYVHNFPFFESFLNKATALLFSTVTENSPLAEFDQLSEDRLKTFLAQMDATCSS